MGIKSKFKSYFWLDEEELDETEVEQPKQPRQATEESKVQEPIPQIKSKQTARKENVVNLQSVQKATGAKMVLLEPRVYAEAQEIADHLRSKRVVVVNLQRVSHDQAVRIVDFLSGTVYAIDGDIQRIGMDIFLCSPDNVEVSGSITEWVQNETTNDMRWNY
ncbi:cell division protein SepF [Mangrovibacillus cuniculi]|uniref:Cell division protein SepF n=1 Tax=Mangrovibacillus cuniculi TaxID=2593652 RepID=A0A7S8CA87_9BACI|nr:cell division protein SepF [Mangrovibacillus cuniculi]QPC46270.1 cell division protein SepF [Mangrovibacillus cuniculi]